jgi:hypothetical protein
MTQASSDIDAMTRLIAFACGGKGVNALRARCANTLHAVTAMMVCASSAAETAQFLRTLADVIERDAEKERRSAMN